MELKPAKWPVELVFIANEMGREIYLDSESIKTFLSQPFRPSVASNLRN